MAALSPRTAWLGSALGLGRGITLGSRRENIIIKHAELQLSLLVAPRFYRSVRLRAGRQRLLSCLSKMVDGSTLKDGLDALELVVTDLLAAKEKRELTSDLRHLPEDCEQLVEAAA